jgi:hypothetical protein
MAGVDARSVSLEIDQRGKFYTDELLAEVVRSLALGLPFYLAFDEWSDMRKFSWMLLKVRYMCRMPNGEFTVRSKIADVVKVVFCCVIQCHRCF